MRVVIVGVLFTIFWAISVYPKPCSRNKRCTMPECDHMESLSMCAAADVPCPENHDEVIGKTICDELGKKCCRSYCHGHGSLCWYKDNKCPENFEYDPEGTCKIPGYRCCAPIGRNMTAMVH